MGVGGKNELALLLAEEGRRINDICSYDDYRGGSKEIKVSWEMRC